MAFLYPSNAFAISRTNMLPTFYLSLAFYSAHILSLTVPPLQSISLPSPDSNTSLQTSPQLQSIQPIPFPANPSSWLTDIPSSPSTNFTTTTATAIRCTTPGRGTHPRSKSCWDAWHTIPDTRDVQTIGDRTASTTFNVPLPYRFISCQYCVHPIPFTLLINSSRIR